MLRRPRPGEDDLDAMLEDFESGRVKPAAAAATVVKRAADETAPPVVEAKKTKSKFARDRASRTGAEPSSQTESREPEAKLEPMVEKVVDQLVLRGIVERDVGSVTALPPSGSAWSQADFPPVLKLTANTAGAGATDKASKRSIFAQQFMKMKGGAPASEVGANVSSNVSIPGSRAGFLITDLPSNWICPNNLY